MECCRELFRTCDWSVATCQVWKSNVLPLLQQHIAEQVDSMTTYMLIQHEAAVANLLEVGAALVGAVIPEPGWFSCHRAGLTLPR